MNRRVEMRSAMLRRAERIRGVEVTRARGTVRKPLQFESGRRRRPVDRTFVERVRKVNDAIAAGVERLRGAGKREQRVEQSDRKYLFHDFLSLIRRERRSNGALVSKRSDLRS